MLHTLMHHGRNILFEISANCWNFKWFVVPTKVLGELLQFHPLKAPCTALVPCLFEGTITNNCFTSIKDGFPEALSFFNSNMNNIFYQYCSNRRRVTVTNTFCEGIFCLTIQVDIIWVIKNNQPSSFANLHECSFTWDTFHQVAISTNNICVVVKDVNNLRSCT